MCVYLHGHMHRTIYECTVYAEPPYTVPLYRPACKHSRAARLPSALSEDGTVDLEIIVVILVYLVCKANACAVYM